MISPNHIISPLLHENYTRKRRGSRSRSSLIPESKYDGFRTIDWLKGWIQGYSRESVQLAGKRGWDLWINRSISGLQTWLLLCLIGIFTGIATSIVNMSVAYLSDFKRGICVTEWYLSKDICCQGLIRLGEYCAEYRPWSHLLGGGALIDFLWYIGFSVLLAVVSSFLVSRLSLFASGSGLSELKTILNGFDVDGFLSPLVLVVKFIALPFVVGSGLLVGKEAAMVHIACCIAHFFSPFFSKYKSNEARQREILACAAGAGIATAFGAPIGGVLMSLEAISTFFPSKTMLRSFYCALIASATLQLIDPYRGKRVLYQVDYTRNWQFFEVLFFALLGVIGGILGSVFLRTFRLGRSFRGRYLFASHPVRAVAALAAITSFFAYFNIFTRVDGSELLESLFRECQKDELLGLCDVHVRLKPILSLLWSLVLKTLLPVLSYGLAIPGGLFHPTLVAGAICGRLFGELIQALLQVFPNFATCPVGTPCVSPGMYSLLGAIAGLSGLTKLTVSLTVIMFELTGSLNYIIPCMITLSATKWAGDYFEKVGFLEMIIDMKGYPFLDPRKEYSLPVQVTHKMTPFEQLAILYEGQTLSNMETILNVQIYQGYPVVSSRRNPSLIGYAERNDLLYALSMHKSKGLREIDSKAYFEEQYRERISNALYLTTIVNQVSFLLIKKTPLAVEPAVSMNFALDLFKKMGPRYLIVKKGGKLLGLLTKKDLLDCLEELTVFNSTLIDEDSDLDIQVDMDEAISPDLRHSS